MNKQFAKLALAGSAVLAAGAARADAFDTSAITAAGANVALVGGAVFAVMVGIKVFKWVRRAL